VVDASDRQVSGAAALTVNRAAFDLMVLTDRSVYRPGDTAQVRVSTTRADGAPVAGVAVDLKIEQVDPQGNKSLRVTRTLTTGFDGTAGLRLLAQTKNQYLITTTARDAGGNSVSAERTMWIHDDRGGTDWAWSTVEITADKEAYAPGDTALLLVRAPVSQGRGLLTIESRGLQSALSFPIYYGLALVPVRVTADMAPNVFASVLVPTRDGMSTAEKELVVPPVDNLVEVTVTADKAEYRPGEQGTFQVKTTDRFGRPVQADVALGIVDEALFGLREDLTPELRETFYPRGWNNVTTVGANNGGGWGMKPMMLKTAMEASRANTGAKPETGQAREYFPDTLRFFASVVTDLRGEATVTETLADNLTTWRLTARAVTRATQVGETKTTTLVRKDLIVRLAAPRTLVEGDEMTLVGIVHNLAQPGTSGAEPARVQVRLVAQGVTVVGNAAQTVTVRRGDLARVTWTVRVDSVALATLEARADASFDADALRLTLPVAARGVPAREVQAGSLLTDGRTTLRLTKDARAIDAGTELNISLAPSLAGTMLESLDYLVGYPYGCIEQTMSRFMPDVMVAEVLRTIGRDDPKLTAELPKMVKTGIERIQGMQNPDGGFGWFGGMRSDPYMTAYVVHGLTQAQLAGCAVSSHLYRRAIGSLYGSLPAVRDSGPTAAYLAWALSEASAARLHQPTQGQLGALDTLLGQVYARRDKLDDQARALLLLALDNRGQRDRAQVVWRNLQAYRIAAGHGTHWGKERWGWHWSHDRVETTAFCLLAALRMDPKSETTAKTAQWLMLERTGSRWYSTKDTATALYALSEYARARGELRPQYEATLLVNGEAVKGWEVTPSNAFRLDGRVVVDPQRLKAGDNRLELRLKGKGALYYSAMLEWVTTEDPIHGAGNYLKADRRYWRITPYTDSDGKLAERREPVAEGQPVKSGEVVEVEVTVTSETPLSYVALADPKPAGFEPLDQTSGGTWGGSYLYRELHDEEVTFFADRLRQGKATLSYRLRAETPGTFHALPHQAFAMYRPEARCLSDEALLRVGE
jgi:uncharacterized protein YfaS (alpha-2-macroglobulin family)